jgi:hypothetical protein
MVLTSAISRHHQASHARNPKIQNGRNAAINHAVRLIHAVCGLAGSPTLIDEIRAELRAEKVRAAIRHHNTAAVFDWLMAGLSYQGISNQVAYDYMERHGRAAWHDIEQKLGRGASCPKLTSYWHFHGCRYDKISRTSAEPDHISRCPLPRHDLRNGRLNQTAYSLFLLIRDIVDGDLIGWIDAQLEAADSAAGPDRLTRMAAALIEPMREIYGVSDKVLAMALSALLLGAPEKMGLWTEVGGSMIAIDTLVHNFLHRTGILARFNANHLYGAACYRPGGCADIIQTVAERIDARQFNPSYPKVFPRFVQHAIWRYCAQAMLAKGSTAMDGFSGSSGSVLAPTLEVAFSANGRCAHPIGPHRSNRRRAGRAGTADDHAEIGARQCARRLCRIGRAALRHAT